MNGLTVIFAKSETGKSVYIKCLRKAIFYHTLSPRGKQSIIRRPWSENKRGVFSIVLEDDTEIEFMFEPKHMTCSIIANDGNKASWTDVVPVEALELLGLVVDMRSSTILNVMDNEDAMLFDGSESEHNDRVVSVYSTHFDLIDRLEFFKDEEEITKQSLKYVNSSISGLEEKLSTMHILFDVPTAERYTLQLKRYLDIIEYSEVSLPVIKDLMDMQQQKPLGTLNNTDLVNLTSSFNLGNTCNKILAMLHEFNHVACNLPVARDSEIDYLFNLSSATNTYATLNNLTQGYLFIPDSLPIIADAEHNSMGVLYTKCSTMLKLLELIKEYTLLDCESLYTITEPESERLNKSSDICIQLHALLMYVISHGDLVTQLMAIREQAELIEEENRLLLQDMKVCALCGKPYTDEGCDTHE